MPSVRGSSPHHSFACMRNPPWPEPMGTNTTHNAAMCLRAFPAGIRVRPALRAGHGDDRNRSYTMTTSATPRPARISGATTRAAAYWISTALLGAECLGGGVMGALRLPPFIDTATHLGYPTYFMTILRVWYVAAGIVVLAPRLPRLKEWACAGLMFNYPGAAFSHVWMGDGLEKRVGPVIFIGLTLTSWALRPEARRAFNTSPLPAAGFSRKRLVAYWIATVLVAAELAVGGVL